jgi:hypothetical protein
MLNIKALRPSDHYFPSDIMKIQDKGHEGHTFTIMIKDGEHSYKVQKVI